VHSATGVAAALLLSADQRYYGPGTGRFLTADPYRAGFGPGRPADPRSWNRYSYVKGDPINFWDRRGTCSEDDEWSDCDDDDGDGGGGGSGQAQPDKKQPPHEGGGDVPCPPLPTLPTGMRASQIQENVNAAHAFFNTAMRADPETALNSLLGFFAGKFLPNGDWDYKKNYAAGTEDQRNARIFGNFDFGAVLESFGFSYTFTQNAAGLAQVAICVTGGSCGTGFPLLSFPYGDQKIDAADIKKGYDYQKAKDGGCVPE
jgi:RHS repeat-associated protein